MNGERARKVYSSLFYLLKKVTVRKRQAHLLYQIHVEVAQGEGKICFINASEIQFIDSGVHEHRDQLVVARMRGGQEQSPPPSLIRQLSSRNIAVLGMAPSGLGLSAALLRLTPPLVQLRCSVVTSWYGVFWGVN